MEILLEVLFELLLLCFCQIDRKIDCVECEENGVEKLPAYVRPDNWMRGRARMDVIAVFYIGEIQRLTVEEKIIHGFAV